VGELLNSILGNKIIACLVVLVVIAVVGLVVFWAGWVSFVENYELGFTFNRFTGQIEVLHRTGYIVRMPIKYAVHAIDLRPYQLSITANPNGGVSSVSSRVLNAKLVKFNPAGLQTFVSWHGRGAGDILTNLLEIMKCYAFDKESGKDCPFITVLNEINPSQTPTSPAISPAPTLTDTLQVGPSGKKP
jgi:hypothetical protein